MEAKEIWEKYEKILNKNRIAGLFEDTEKAYNFYEGNQWKGLKGAGQNMPFYNFIRPIVNYRFNMVAMNRMDIVFKGMRDSELGENLCRELNKRAAKCWENAKMDKICRRAIKDACIAGESYILFYDEDCTAENIKNTDVFFADESCDDIGSQKFIIIRRRQPVEDVREYAKAVGAGEKTLKAIIPDDDNDEDENLVTTLLYMYKKDGFVHFLRSTKNVIYEKDRAIAALDSRGSLQGLKNYPLAGFVWNRKHMSARGTGECKPLIANQIECNQNLVRRLLEVKMCAYGKPVYNANDIANPEALMETGTAIAVEGSAADVRQSIAYLTPASMSPDAHRLQEEIVTVTRELAGAGDAAIGAVDPTKASGAAIIAVRDQAAIPLNEQVFDYKQMTEDIARIYLDIWCAYNPEGIPVKVGDRMEFVPPVEIRIMSHNITVEVTSTDPYSRYAEEAALENALALGNISFEEYVEALPEGAIAPKSSFKKLIGMRAEEKTA